jgi:predicted membrane chloride channel (bestrophin family)
MLIPLPSSKPYGYDANDLPLGTFCANITAATVRTMTYPPGAGMERCSDEPPLTTLLRAPIEFKV